MFLVKVFSYPVEKRDVMKNCLCFFQGVALSAVTVLFSACSSMPTSQSNALPRFHEEATTDVVVEFPGWQAIAITKPNTDQGGFRNFLTRPQVEQQLAKLPVRHNLAVVAYRFNYSQKDQAEHQEAWSGIFKKLGFQRVVFVRAIQDRQINGALVLRDMPLTASVSTATPENASFANASQPGQ